MKLTTLALMGMASAAEELMFMKESGNIIDDDTELLSIGSGACINWSFSRNLYFDLKKFDENSRKDKMPAFEKFDKFKGEFIFKPCQTPFKMTADVLTAVGLDPKKEKKWDDFLGNAYWTEEGNPKYSFLNGDI